MDWPLSFRYHIPLTLFGTVYAIPILDPIEARACLKGGDDAIGRLLRVLVEWPFVRTYNLGVGCLDVISELQEKFQELLLPRFLLALGKARFDVIKLIAVLFWQQILTLPFLFLVKGGGTGLPIHTTAGFSGKEAPHISAAHGKVRRLSFGGWLGEMGMSGAGLFGIGNGKAEVIAGEGLVDWLQPAELHRSLVFVHATVIKLRPISLSNNLFYCK
jgi:hypothetical protein